MVLPGSAVLGTGGVVRIADTVLTNDAADAPQTSVQEKVAFLGTKRNFESGLRRDQDSPRGPAARRRVDGQKQEPHHVSGEHGMKSESSNNKNWLSGRARLRRD